MVVLELVADRPLHAGVPVTRLRDAAGTGQVEIVVAVGVDHAHAARANREERVEPDSDDAADRGALAREQRLARGKRPLYDPRLEGLGHEEIVVDARSAGGERPRSWPAPDLGSAAKDFYKRLIALSHRATMLDGY